MKKLLAVALVSVSVLCLATGQASAWPLRHCWCCNKCNKCCVSCSQYNAFSPVCCDTPCHGPYGYGNPGYPPVCANYGDGGCGNQLPAGNAAAYAPAPTYAGPLTAPGYNPAYANAAPVQTYGNQGVAQGYNPMPSYPTSVARPNGTTSYYPGTMGYAPAYNMGR